MYVGDGACLPHLPPPSPSVVQVQGHPGQPTLPLDEACQEIIHTVFYLVLTPPAGLLEAWTSVPLSLCACSKHHFPALVTTILNMPVSLFFKVHAEGPEKNG